MAIELANGSITVRNFQSIYQGEMVQVIASRDITDSYFGFTTADNLWEAPAAELDAILIKARNFIEVGA